jgi:hypothetical protein
MQNAKGEMQKAADGVLMSLSVPANKVTAQALRP